MSLAARILHDDIPVIDAATEARALHQGLYITEHGQVVIAPQCRPGWTRIAVRVKSPTQAHLVPLPCAA